ncbi:TPA: hypothetical protein ACPD3K_000587 [Pasteurella multocida]
MKNKPILDACCGSRMFHFNKNNPAVLYEEPNGMLLVVNEITSEQVPIPSEFMSKNKLTYKEVEKLFKNGSF